LSGQSFRIQRRIGKVQSFDRNGFKTITVATVRGATGSVVVTHSVSAKSKLATIERDEFLKITIYITL
jgi:hypothetical protein